MTDISAAALALAHRAPAQGGWTALTWAGSHGYADCVRLLLDAGADKEAKIEVCGRSAAEIMGVILVFGVLEIAMVVCSSSLYFFRMLIFSCDCRCASVCVFSIRHAAVYCVLWFDAALPGCYFSVFCISLHLCFVLSTLYPCVFRSTR